MTAEAARVQDDGLGRMLSGATAIVAVGTGLLFLYSAQFGLFQTMVQRGLMIGSMLLLIYLHWARERGPMLLRLLLILLGLVGVAATAFLAVWRDTIALRPTGPEPFELVVGGVLVLLVLDAGRRAMGWPLPIIAVVVVGYAMAGKYIPGIFHHRGVPIEYLIQYLSMETEGLWGVPIAVASTYIVLFVILGAVLRASGAGQFMIDFAYALLGGFRGGPAKMGVVASAMFGTVSGSTVANVVGTGTFTIPMMKRVGYRPEFAGAVEAVASCGGQLVPPVMGAAAFIMAEILGIPYTDVIVAALLPALLFYFSIFLSVDLEAARLGFRGLPRRELPPLVPLLKRAYLLAPLLVLILLMVIMGWTPLKAGFWSIALALGLAFLDPAVRRRPQVLLRSIGEGVEDMAGVAAACACAGLIIGALSVTGLTLKLSGALIAVSGGNVYVLLVLTMLTSLVLGMGLPTVACYILLVILVAPALIDLGINPLAAHLFVFYFGIISGITPPVAMAAFASAVIAGAGQMRTGFVALRIGLSAFILPYMFVTGPELLLQGKPGEIVLAVITASIGIWALTAAAIGQGFGPLAIWERGLLLAGAVAFISPEAVTDLIALAFLVPVAVHRVVRLRREGRPTSVSPARSPRNAPSANDAEHNKHDWRESINMKEGTS